MNNNSCVRLGNLIKICSTQLDEGISVFDESFRLLAQIFESQNNKKCISIKEIIYARRFGTEKTIYRKIKELECLGYILLVTASDRRVKEVRITKRGSDLLSKIAYGLMVVD